MNGHANGSANSSAHGNRYDMIVIGAGVAGIDTAYRLQEKLPHRSFTILEGRHDLGGTWSLFKYPGVRSDSDIFTYSFPFNPWQKESTQAKAHEIHEYMWDTARKFGIDKKIQFRHKVVSCDWSSENQRWKVEVDAEDPLSGNTTRKIYYTKWIFAGTGYYDYKKPLPAEIPGLANFKGTTVHPQFWPEDLDYKGKKMVIIGSGATAVSLLPALVEGGASHATILQRSPSYVTTMPVKKPGSFAWTDLLPRGLKFSTIRFQYNLYWYIMFMWCKMFPTRAANWLRAEARKRLPKGYQMDPHFFPKYNPWDQRLCYTYNDDFFECLGSGKANIVTGTIKEVVEDGIILNENGQKITADIIVTATGLQIALFGNAEVTVDKKPFVMGEKFAWNSAMLSGVPNLSFMVGYAHASYTVGAEHCCRIAIRVIQHMEKNGYTSVTPKITAEEAKSPQPLLPLMSTYAMKAAERNAIPWSASNGPWKPRINMIWDGFVARWGSLTQGMEYKTVST